MFRFKKTCLFLIIFLSSVVSVHAADSPKISVKAEVNKAFITIGEPVEFTVQIRRSNNVQILSQIPPPPDDILKIKKVQDIKREEDGLFIEGRKFILTTFKLGQFVLDPIEIEYRTEGSEVKSIKTDPIYITVKSVAEGKEKTDIRGIKSVVDFLQSTPGKVIGASLVIIILAVLFLIYRLTRKKKIEDKESEPKLTAEEEAMIHLNQLFDSDLLRKGKTKEYFFRLSEILRYYFERRFQILAVESTTYEIIKVLRDREIDRVLLERIHEVLEAADLAKFAKWKPEPPEIVGLNQKSKQIIELAKPKDI